MMFWNKDTVIRMLFNNKLGLNFPDIISLSNLKYYIGSVLFKFNENLEVNLNNLVRDLFPR